MTNTKAERIIDLVDKIKQQGANSANLSELKQLGAKSAIITILQKRYGSKKEQNSGGEAASESTSIENLTSLIMCGDCFSFHSFLASRISQEDSGLLAIKEEIKANPKMLEKIFQLINPSSSGSPSLEQALKAGDERFTRGLFRSSAIIYGLTHLAWPLENSWTLYNWKRSLQQAHPEIFTIVSDFIQEP